ncbi:molecular chaperone DnaJ [Pseudoclavibacter sp. AY1H1]|uniref:molecular chaperone DnaJ n=1 Tax=Pseudoclavibacter sp. AY1H1 TaxID=2080584 RepID=UPI000CE7B956|nr:molecular chaperone DnaJ [Pseudoclavibacter sp. AY1H1]PPF39806.1 molecular chaperone DnaJ [Pseudoclavibacter sp. AY1H1]
MTSWPDELTVDPIGEWPGTLTRARRRSDFASTWTQTLELMDRETRMLGGKNVHLQVAIPPQHFRLDGRPRAIAKVEHPGVILTLDSKHGALSYPCDTFENWQDNVRAIALALEALRKVDRYGVTRGGEQYRGFLAIDAGSTMTVEGGAWNLIFRAALDVSAPYDFEPEVAERAVRIAKLNTHPDTGGRAEDFQRVTEAEQHLREAGEIYRAS